MYLCQQNENDDMETATLNPTQMHFQSRLDAEADRLWDEGILNQEKLDELRHKDLHAK